MRIVCHCASKGVIVWEWVKTMEQFLFSAKIFIMTKDYSMIPIKLATEPNLDRNYTHAVI